MAQVPLFAGTDRSFTLGLHEDPDSSRSSNSGFGAGVGARVNRRAVDIDLRRQWTWRSVGWWLGSDNHGASDDGPTDDTAWDNDRATCSGSHQVLVRQLSTTPLAGSGHLATCSLAATAGIQPTV